MVKLVTLGRGQKVKYYLHVNFKDFLYQTLCVFTQIKDRKHIGQNFHSVARVMPCGGTCGCWGESKALAWVFAMAPNGLSALACLFQLVPYFRHSIQISTTSKNTTSRVRVYGKFLEF